MAPGISKRQQLRNEKTLQDLIRSVPGNDRCADCGAVNPGMDMLSPGWSFCETYWSELTCFLFPFSGWASWNVCIRPDLIPALPLSLLCFSNEDDWLSGLCSWVSFYACGAHRCIASWGRTSQRLNPWLWIAGRQSRSMWVDIISGIWRRLQQDRLTCDWILRL